MCVFTHVCGVKKTSTTTMIPWRVFSLKAQVFLFLFGFVPEKINSRTSRVQSLILETKRLFFHPKEEGKKQERRDREKRAGRAHTCVWVCCWFLPFPNVVCVYLFRSLLKIWRIQMNTNRWNEREEKRPLALFKVPRVYLFMLGRDGRLLTLNGPSSPLGSPDVRVKIQGSTRH